MSELSDKLGKDPAFPKTNIRMGNGFAAERPIDYGLTKREYFASLFMQATISDHESVRACTREAERMGESPDDYIAKSSAILADALLLELAKGTT